MRQVWFTTESEQPMENVWWKLKKLKLQLNDNTSYMVSYKQIIISFRKKLDIIQAKCSIKACLIRRIIAVGDLKIVKNRGRGS